MAAPRKEDPRDLEAIRCLRAALPTRRRAELLFETLAARFAQITPENLGEGILRQQWIR